MHCREHYRKQQGAPALREGRFPATKKKERNDGTGSLEESVCYILWLLGRLLDHQVPIGCGSRMTENQVGGRAGVQEFQVEEGYVA